jgi:hypothetical protein
MLHDGFRFDHSREKFVKIPVSGGLFSIRNSSLWGIQGRAIARIKEAIGQPILPLKTPEIIAM